MSQVATNSDAIQSVLTDSVASNLASVVDNSQPSVVIEQLAAKTAKIEGRYGSKRFKLFVTEPKDGNNLTSPWHSIPLMNEDGSYNMVVEIPMYSTAKMEMNKKEPKNPIMQDVNKDGTVRYYTYGKPFFNYGFFPQTWEDDEHIDEMTGTKGDGDPIDCIEIGSSPLAMGSVVPVKILGCFDLIDEGETDYKIVVIRRDDPRADKITTLYDVSSADAVTHTERETVREREGVTAGEAEGEGEGNHHPHEEHKNTSIIAKLVDWLKNYKTTDGKPPNKLRSDLPLSPEQTKQIIAETHSFYQHLLARRSTDRHGYALR